MEEKEPKKNTEVEEKESEEIDLDNQNDNLPDSNPSEKTGDGFMDLTNENNPSQAYPTEAIKAEIRRKGLKEKFNSEPKEQREPTRREIKEKIREVNEDPETKIYRAKVMKKSTFIMMCCAIGILILLLGTQVVWGNINFLKKNFAPNVTINSPITVSPPDVTSTTNNQYNLTTNIENKLEIPEAGIDRIIEEVIEGINNETE